jgi:hypothetical protein
MLQHDEALKTRAVPYRRDHSRRLQPIPCGAERRVNDPMLLGALVDQILQALAERCTAPETQGRVRGGTKRRT